MSADIALHPAHGSRSLPPWAVLFATALVLVLYAFAPWPEWLIYDRDAIRNGELWRIVTAHWIHTDRQHLLLNAGVLVLMGMAWRPRGRALVIALAAGSLVVSGSLLFVLPELTYYCGLSGVLNTILVLTLARLWHDTRHPIVAIVAVCAVAKIIIELQTQQPLVSDTLWPPIAEAHLAGFLTGVALLPARLHAG